MAALSPADAWGGGVGAVGGGRGSASSSPEFEFWMMRNPSQPQPVLLSADELFVDGVILPLRFVHQAAAAETPRQGMASETAAKPEAASESPFPRVTATAAEPVHQPPSSSVSPAPCNPAHISSSAASSSKRWKDIFKVTGGEKRMEEKDRRKERKNSAGGMAELNINIWPFSRSRSAGNGASRPKGTGALTASGRRVSSAPCSRSNSLGESSRPPAPSTGVTASSPSGSAPRRWASSPGRAGLAAGAGIHVGRSSPVWQARRSGKKGQGKEGGGGRKGGWGSGGVKVNLNVNTCIGYGQQGSCRAEEKGVPGGGGGRVVTPTATGNHAGSGSHFTSLRAFFSRKVY